MWEKTKFVILFQVTSSHRRSNFIFLYSTLRDYIPLVPGLELLQYKIHGGAIQEKNNAIIITDVCLSDPFLSRPCKVHIDFFFSDGRKLVKWVDQYIYLYP